MQMLNVACGGRYHKDWINIDFHADSKAVGKVNILLGLPFDNESMDVVYCSHFLEHLSLKEGEVVVDDIYRVLKPSGIVRIVVPDLENICKEYLRILEGLDSGNNNSKKYEWITIELLDQMVRDTPGGEMSKIFRRVSQKKDEELCRYIYERTGDELLQINTINKKREITLDKIVNKVMYIYLRFIRFLIPKNLREHVFVGASIGERHRWMFDRWSLAILLKRSGFKDVLVEKYKTSRIENFNSYKLDIRKDNTPYKGKGSIYIEGIK